MYSGRGREAHPEVREGSGGQPGGTRVSGGTLGSPEDHNVFQEG